MANNLSLEERNALVSQRDSLKFAKRKAYDCYIINFDTGVSYKDLEQEAVLGLLQAAEKYDSNRGVKFITYAYPWVSRNLARFVLQHMHIPKRHEIPSRRKNSREYKLVSLDEPFCDEEDGIALSETISSGRYLEKRVTENIYVKSLLSHLTEKEKLVFVMVVYDDKSQIEVAKKIGRSQMQVSRIYRRACEKLRRVWKNAELS